MNCWHCNTELIWGGDHDIYIEDGYNFDGIVTNLSCPKCPTYVDVWLKMGDEVDDKITN